MNSSGRLLRMGVPILIGVLVLIVAIARVGADDSDDPSNGTPPDDERRVEPITVEAVDVRLAESYPVQVFVEVTGYVPDPCWEPQEPVVSEQGDRFEIEIVAERDPTEICAQAIEDYQSNIPLGSPDPGEYTVAVNGMERTFEVN